MKKIKKIKVKKIKAPTGFFFKIQESRYKRYGKHPTSVEVKLYDTLTRTRLGTVTLCRNHFTGSYVTHSHLRADYHGKGLGTLMYARAIQWCHERGYVVRSSGSSSDMAQRVWKSSGLRNHYAVRCRKHKSNPRYDTWYAYQR